MLTKGWLSNYRISNVCGTNRGLFQVDLLMLTFGLETDECVHPV